MDTQGQRLIFAPGKAIMKRSAGQKQSEWGRMMRACNEDAGGGKPLHTDYMELMYEKAYFI